MRIINLTPHNINILDFDERTVITVPRSMKVARMDSDKILQTRPFCQAFDFPMFNTKYSTPYLAKINDKGEELERLQFPEQKPDIIYIVSSVFYSEYSRSDLWAPGELVRDASGQPIGCIGLSQ
jgi:hypothetical protein